MENQFAGEGGFAVGEDVRDDLGEVGVGVFEEREEFVGGVGCARLIAGAPVLERGAERTLRDAVGPAAHGTHDVRENRVQAAVVRGADGEGAAELLVCQAAALFKDEARGPDVVGEERGEGVGGAGGRRGGGHGKG